PRVVSSAGLPAFFGVSGPNALAAGFCAPRQNPTFSFGFAALNAQLGASMGTPLDCEHSNPAKWGHAAGDVRGSRVLSQGDVSRRGEDDPSGDCAELPEPTPALPATQRHRRR